jgi:Phosphatidylinositol-specific phospholipase C, Y domain/C2 domain
MARELREHCANFLLRVYPTAGRVGSSNLKILRGWQHGAQFVALNWQTFDRSMGFNRAMFGNESGYVLKPGYVHDETIRKDKFKLSLMAIGACGLPSEERENFTPYLKVVFYGEDKTKRVMATRKKGTDVVWNELFDFGTVVDNLAFLRYIRGDWVDGRIQVYDDKKGRRDNCIASYTARLAYLQPGIRGKCHGNSRLSFPAIVG